MKGHNSHHEANKETYTQSGVNLGFLLFILWDGLVFFVWLSVFTHNGTGRVEGKGNH